MTQAEFDETLHVAMTVGATRMQVMMGQEATSSGTSEPPAPSPTFEAQEVVSQAAGG